MTQPCKALEAMKKEILENGIGALRAKGIQIKLESITGQVALVTVNVVDSKGNPLVEITKNTMRPGDTTIVLELDEAFHFSLE